MRLHHRSEPNCGQWRDLICILIHYWYNVLLHNLLAVGSQDFSSNVPYAAGSPLMESNSRCRTAPETIYRCHARCRSSQYHNAADMAQVAPYMPAAPRIGMRRPRTSATGDDVSMTSGCESYNTAISAQNNTPTNENIVQHGAQQRTVQMPVDVPCPLLTLIICPRRPIEVGTE